MTPTDRDRNPASIHLRRAVTINLTHHTRRSFVTAREPISSTVGGRSRHVKLSDNLNAIAGQYPGHDGLKRNRSHEASHMPVFTGMPFIDDARRSAGSQQS